MSRYIDADKLKSEFPIRRNNYDEEHGDVHFINGIESVFEYIDYMPTADVEEVKHGEWITSGPLPRTYGRPRSMCSRCGALARYELVNVGVYHEDLSKRCPECGAKMDGGAQ